MHEQPSRARHSALLEEAVGEELLIYDQNSHTAHCLSPIAACVWRHCDGQRDLTKLAQLARASETLVADALHELREKDLLVGEPELTQSAVPGLSRREAIGRVARYGAAAAAVPLIVSATASTPAMASSSEGGCPTGTCTPLTFYRCCCCRNGEKITIYEYQSCETGCINAGYGTALGPGVAGMAAI
jgi:hypothetical protein